MDLRLERPGSHIPDVPDFRRRRDRCRDKPSHTVPARTPALRSATSTDHSLGGSYSCQEEARRRSKSGSHSLPPASFPASGSSTGLEHLFAWYPEIPCSESRLAIRETGYSQPPVPQIAPGCRPDQGSPAPDSARRSVAIPPAARGPAAARACLPAKLRPAPKIRAYFRLPRPKARSQPSRKHCEDGTPIPEPRIPPPAKRPRRPAHDPVPRMFPTNGDLRSRVPPMTVRSVFRSVRFFAQFHLARSVVNTAWHTNQAGPASVLF